MSNSKLVSYTKLSPHCTKMDKKVNRKITIHHMAGNLSLETCGEIFQNNEASANYGIDSNGKIGMFVEEKDRAWASCDWDNDSQSINIEVANDQIGGNWHVSDKALKSLIDLCVDICKRNGIKELVYTGDASGNLTRHNMFAATACPGPYLQSKFSWIAKEVNRKLKKNFKDVNEKAWYAEAVAFCADNGIMKGTGNNMFEPNRNITRAEVAQVVFNLYKKLK